MLTFATVEDDVFPESADGLAARITRAPAVPAPSTVIAICGRSTDDGEATGGARFAPLEIRRRLYALPPDPNRRARPAHDFGDATAGSALDASLPTPYALLFGGGHGALNEDVAAFGRIHPGGVSLVVSARTDHAGTIVFGARDAVPSERIVTRDELFDAAVSPLEFADRRLDLVRARPTLLSIHLDAFDLPGVADPSALGLSPREFWALYRAWLRRLDVRVVGIYGVCPPLDPNALTTRYAARLAHAFLHV